MTKNKKRTDKDESGVSSEYLSEVAARGDISLTWSKKGKPIVAGKKYENNASAASVMHRINVINKRKKLIAMRQYQSQQKGIETW